MRGAALVHGEARGERFEFAAAELQELVAVLALHRKAVDDVGEDLRHLVLIAGRQVEAHHARVVVAEVEGLAVRP